MTTNKEERSKRDKHPPLQFEDAGLAEQSGNSSGICTDYSRSGNTTLDNSKSETMDLLVESSKMTTPQKTSKLPAQFQHLAFDCNVCFFQIKKINLNLKSF